MGISVEGQKCPICGGYLFDNDDLVFCPECGAPHHRDCYAAIGHCGLAEYHGTAEQYQRPKPQPEPEPDQAGASVPNPAQEQAAVRRCSSCGQTFSVREPICPHCGAPAGPVVSPFGFAASYDPMGGVGKEELIGDVPAADMRDYVAVNTPRYLPRFKQLNTKGRFSWNWAAFFFPNAWFFYRKIYLPGVLFFLLTLTASGLASSVNLIFETMPEEALKNYGTIMNYFVEHLSELNMLPFWISLIGMGIGLAIRIIAGLTGDRLYRSSAISRIHRIRESDPPIEMPLALRQAGSISPMLGLLGLFALQWMVYFLYMFL